MLGTVKSIGTALLLWLLLTIITGLAYPVIVTIMTQILFPWERNGSLIQKNNKTIGSALIGQSYKDIKYFWGRPSATSFFPYNAEYSAGSNFGPTNPQFLQIVRNQVDFLNRYRPHSFIPVDLVTSSGSGLDPDISPAGAYFQIPRIAQARGLSESELIKFVKNHIQQPTLGFIGEARVNVLKLNLDLEELANKRTPT